MWNDEQKQRFQALRTRELRQELTTKEQVELAHLIQLLEDEEATYLRPATQRLEQSNLEMAARNAALKTLVEREKRLNHYLQRVLKKVDHERQAISAELASILEASSTSVQSR